MTLWKYLGIILIHQLNFKQNISKITKQVARAAGILWKVRKFLPEKFLLSLNHAIIKGWELEPLFVVR